MASFNINSPPTPRALAPASMNAAQVSRFTPPAGTSGISGNGPFSARMELAPPTCEHGNIFTRPAPNSQADITSVGVRAPAIIRILFRWANSSVFRFIPGLTRNCAPASRQRWAASALRTVPTPTKIWGIVSAMRETTAVAPGTVMVISTTSRPPARTASAANSASSAVVARITGMIPVASARCNTMVLFTDFTRRRSTNDPGAYCFHHLFHFLERGHGGVSGSGHRQRAVRRATFHGPLRAFAGEKSIDQPRGEGIAAAHAVINFQIVSVGSFVESPIAVTDRAPIIPCGAGGFAQSGSDHLERKIFQNDFDHGLEIFGGEIGVFVAHSLHVVTERGGKIFFVAEHDVHVSRELAIYQLRLFLAAIGFPERIAIIQIVGDEDAIFMGGAHRLHRDGGRRVREGAEDPTGVEPAHAEFTKNVIPVDVAFL